MSFISTEMETVELETLFVHFEQESSEEPPMDEWSSLLSHEPISDTPKRAAYKRGEYDPGSGEICAEFVFLSDSSVRRHVYYKYPAVKDPGIIQALTLPEPKHVYNENGQELYLDLCEEMNLIPIRKFLRGLLEKEINLKYYGVNPVGIRAMCLSLAGNRVVKRLDLTSNFLTHDACYHLGELLKDNYVLDELILAECKIGPLGMLRIVPHLRLRTMKVLDVSSNALEDEGFQHLAEAMANGAVIKRLNLSHNSLGADSARLLAEVLEANNKMTHLNVSWNQMYDNESCGALLRILSKNKVLVELDFSWNNLTITEVRLQSILRAPNLRILNLNNNRLGRASARTLSRGLLRSKKLQTLDLSYNPLGPKGALLLLQSLNNSNVSLMNLFMDGVGVAKEFREELQEIMKLPFREDLTVTYDRVARDYVLPKRDLRAIVLKRLDYVFARSSKKCRVDISLYLMRVYKERQEDDFLMENDLLRFMKSSNLKPDQDIIEHLVTLFPGPKFEKAGRSIKLSTIVEYIHRLWPDKELPPTPPAPTPPPEEPQKKSKKKLSKPKK